MATYQDITPSDRLTMTLFFAGVLHAIIIFGVSFDLPKAKKIAKSLEIALVNTVDQKAPDKADYLAQQNQIGSGTQNKKSKPSASVIEQRKQPQKVAEKAEKPDGMKATTKPVLTQNNAKQQVPVRKPKDNTDKGRKRTVTAEQLSMQIAQLGAELTKAYEDYSKRPRIRYINSVNAHKYKAASYERAWQQKTERVGNLNYPEEARRKNLSGGLLLSVGINQDGTIHSIKVLSSSRHKALDDAAVRIVRLAAPYAPFPDALAEESDVLVITRTWKFFDNNRMATSR